MLVVAGLLFAAVEGMIRFGSIDQAIAFFPYFQVHQPVFLDPEKNLSPASLERLKRVYLQSSDFYHYLANTGTPEVKVQAIETIYQLDPWQRIHQDPITYYLEQEDWTKVETLLNDLTAFLAEGIANRQYSREEILYQQKTRWAQQLLKLAEHQAEQGRIAEAADNTIKAQYWDEWILAHTPLLPLKLDWPQREAFLWQTTTIQPQYWADYREDLANMWLEIILSHLQAGDWRPDQIKQASFQTLALAEMRAHLLWEQTTVQELAPIRAALRRGELAEVKTRADRLLPIWQEIQAFPFVHEPFRDQVNWERTLELATVYEDLARAGIASRRYEFAPELAQAVVLRPDWAVLKYRQYGMWLQGAATTALAEGKTAEAETLLKQMLSVDGYNYWMLTQLGNFYVVTGQRELAVKAFEDCRAQADYYHDDCEQALRELADNDPNPQRYYEVSQIIVSGRH